MHLVSGRRYKFTDTVDQGRRQPFVRLTGRDQRGSEFEAEIYGPGRQGWSRFGEPGEPGNAAVDDAALRDTLRPHDGMSEISANRALQHLLDAHYQRQRSSAK